MDFTTSNVFNNSTIYHDSSLSRDPATAAAPITQVACFDGREEDHPQVTLSFAQSLDGSIAAQRGRPVAISSVESFRMTHSLRSRHDAIAVGIGTLMSDNPSLNTRLVQGASPQPIVFDSSLRCPRDCKLLTMHETCRKPILVASEAALRDDEAVRDRRTALVAAGAEVIVVSSDSTTGRIDLDNAFELLTKRYSRIMVEGGASIITAMLRGKSRRWITRIVLTMAPSFMGGLRCVQAPLQPLPKNNKSDDNIKDDNNNNKDNNKDHNNNNTTLEFQRMRFVQVQLMGGDLVVVLDPASSPSRSTSSDITASSSHSSLRLF